MLGLRALEIPTDPVSGLSLGALRQALEDVPVKALLVTPAYSNPTGACLSDSAKQEILELVSIRDIALIEDDTFGELSHSPQRPRALRSYDERGQVMLCSSFSKTLAPGYRVGWIISPPRYLARLHQLKLFSNIASPALPALAINDFLAEGGYDHHLRNCRRIYGALMHQMAEAVLRHFPAGTRVSRPRGGFVLWVQLPSSYDTRPLYPQALQLGMTFGPGPIFSARGRFRNCLRLCAPYWSAEREQMLARFGDLLNPSDASGIEKGRP